MSKTPQFINNIRAALPSLKPYLWICIFTFLALAFLWANPGYFNHDEFQRLDHVKAKGLRNYLDAYVQVKAGSHFGYPVRPFAFAIQGFLSLFMENYPIIVHGFAVASHALTACLIYKITRLFGGKTNTALTAALIFAMNPMIIHTVGWSAALMDRLYVMFGAAALIYAYNYLKGDHKLRSLIYLFFASSLAILSKETALILPILMLVFVVQDWRVLSTKRFWITGIIWSIPIIIFMIIRFPALMASLSGDAKVSAYQVSASNLWDSLYAYTAYPYVIKLTLAHAWVGIKPIWMYLALAGHALMLVFLWRKFSLKTALLYVVLYIAFLLPILPLPGKGSHYLYGSATVFSIALACLFTMGNGKLKKLETLVIQGFVVGAIFVLALHSLYNQRSIYVYGLCMNKAMASVESEFLSNGKPNNITFSAKDNGPFYVLARTYSGRNRIGDTTGIKFNFIPTVESAPEGSSIFAIDRNCIVTTNLN